MLIFFHITKTGGVSLMTKFKREFNDIHIITNPASYNKINYKKGHDVLMGHNLLNIHTKFENEIDCEYICFFRNPIDQFLSNFYWIKKTPHNVFHRYIKNLSLEDFLDSDLNLQCFDNHQVRLMSGTYVPKKITHSDIDFKLNGDEYYEKALENLERIDNIFLTEYYDDSLVILKNKYNLSSKFLNKDVVNKSKNRKKLNELSDDLTEKIKDKVKYDIMLYDIVKSKTKELYEKI